MSIGEIITSEERLTRLLEDAKKRAERIVAEAQDRASALVTSVRRREFTQEVLREEEAKARDEAKKIIRMYRKKARKIENLPDELIQRAVDVVTKEVFRT